MEKKHIHTSSKKIMKSKKVNSPKIPASPHQSSTTTKKYKTFDKSNKLVIITALMNELGFPLEGTKVDPNKILACLKNINLDSYNESLARVLIKYVASFINTTSRLKQWRRKIQDWIQNFNKPEKRGGVIVPSDQLSWFKGKLFPILQSLPFKSFNRLRESLLDILEEMYNNEKKSFPKNSCSKHFWYDFMAKNPDVAAAYESLPARRNAKKESFNLTKNHQVQERDDQTTETTFSSPGQSSPNIYFSESNGGLFENSNFNCSSDSEGMSLEEVHSVDLIQNHRTIALQNQDSTIDFIMENKDSISEEPRIDFDRNEPIIKESEENPYQMECYGEYFKRKNELDILPAEENTLHIDPIDPEIPNAYIFSLGRLPDKDHYFSPPSNWKLSLYDR